MQAHPTTQEPQRLNEMPPSPMATPAGAGRYLGGDDQPIDILTLSDWRVKGIGPAFVKVGRLVRYRLVDLDSWIESRRTPTSEQEV